MVEHGAQGEEVGASIEVLAQRLFGRHVGDSTNGAAQASQIVLGHLRGRTRSVGSRILPARYDFGKTEVQDLGVTAFGDKDIRGLDVAMDDALLMCRAQSPGRIDADLHDPLQLHPAIRDQVLQSRPLQEFHYDERAPGFFANIVDRADVGMVQSGSGLRLTSKTIERLGILRHFIRKEFERHKPM